MRRRHHGTRQVGRLDHVLLHLLGQRDHHRAWPARHRNIRRMRDDFRDALRLVDLRHPLGERAEHPAIVHLLECVASGVLMRDLPDEQQQRRAVLHSDMHADRAVARAGPARHHRRRGAPFQLAERLGHVHRAGLEAAGHQLQLLAHVVEAVEHIEIALARHSEYMVDALRDQGIGERAASRAWDDPSLPRLSQFHASLLLCPVRALAHRIVRSRRFRHARTRYVETRSASLRTFRRSLDGVCSPQIEQNVCQFPPLPRPNDWVSAETYEQEVPRCFRA